MEKQTERQLLIVDRYPYFAWRLAQELAECEPNFRIETCYSGPQALKQGDCKPFDLVIVELSLGDLNGLKLIWLLRQQLRHQNYILMVNDTSTLKAAQTDPLWENVAHHIVKPFDIADIQMLIHATL